MKKKQLSVTVLIDSEYFFYKDPDYLGTTKESAKTLEYFLVTSLRRNGYRVSVVPVENDVCNLINRLKEQKPDLIYNYVQQFDGNRKGEVYIPSLLDMCNFRYTGPDAYGCMLSIDKKLCKDVLHRNGILVPKCIEITECTDYNELLVEFPVIVKPNFDGGSTGITNQSIAKNKKQLISNINKLRKLKYTSILVESFIVGRDVTVPVFGNGENLHVYPPREVHFFNPRNGWSILTHNIKWSSKVRSKRVYASKLTAPKALCDEINKTTQKVFTLLKMRDFARIDFRINEKNEVYVIDTNCNPGLNPTSWADTFSGRNFDLVVKELVENALARYSKERK